MSLSLPPEKSPGTAKKQPGETPLVAAALLKTDTRILLFDGVCNLCNGSVQWVIRHDKNARFKFAALQSAVARSLLAQLDTEPGKAETMATTGTPASICLIWEGHVYRRSAAIIRIVTGLGGAWNLFAAAWIVPGFLRDALYKWVAAHRYKWFGQRESCMVPTPELRSRFLDMDTETATDTDQN